MPPGPSQRVVSVNIIVIVAVIVVVVAVQLLPSSVTPLYFKVIKMAYGI